MALRRPLAWLNKRRSWKITYHAPALPVPTLEITKRSPHRPPYNTSVSNQIDQIFPSNHYLSNSDYGIFVDRGLRTACCLVDAAASKERPARVRPLLGHERRACPSPAGQILPQKTGRRRADMPHIIVGDELWSATLYGIRGPATSYLLHSVINFRQIGRNFEPI